MTDHKLLIFGSFTEDEIKSLQRLPMKNNVEITFGSLDPATLRSVGIFNSNLTKVDSSKRVLPSKDFNKENLSSPSSTEKASISASFFQENGSAGAMDCNYHSTSQEVVPCNKSHQLRSECPSITANNSSMTQNSTENLTELSTSLDDIKLSELRKDFKVGNGRVTAIEESNGPAKTIKFLQPRGLVNLGNLCFLNATLQALLACAPFVQLLQDLRTRDIPETGYPTLHAFVEFISDFDMPLKSTVMRKEMLVMETGKPFRPLMFELILKSFTPDVPNSLTGRPRQEDAQEFLSFIMHQMHEELLKLEDQLPNGLGTNSLVSSIHVDDDENWETVGPRNRTAITRTQSFVPSKLSEIFGGQLKSIVKARGIKTSATVQPFLLIHLNICPDPVCTIEDALRLFSAPETLEGYRISADGKAEVVNASKSVKILELSDVMVLHLMRFTYGSEGSTKLHKSVHFPLELIFGRDLLVSPYSEGRRYELVATITHHGMDPYKGHYTADARHASGKWLRYDDAAVIPIPTSKVLHEQAYILFYKQL